MPPGHQGSVVVDFWSQEHDSHI